MNFKCKHAELGFLEVAPIKLSYSIVINATPKQVYAALIDPQTWPEWFPGMTKASAMEDDKEGLSRIVTLNHLIDFKEEFIANEPNKRVAYRVAAISIPYADELVEELTLEEVGEGVLVNYRIGLRVHKSLSWISRLVQKIGESSYEKALINLKVFMEK